MTQDLVWDDHLWEQVWEQNLSHVERHDIAMAVLRRRLPSDGFQARVAVELARRWARHAVTLSVVYLLWCLFWGALGWEALVSGAAAAGVPVGCTVVGVAAVAACLAFRGRLRRLIRLWSTPAATGTG